MLQWTSLASQMASVRRGFLDRLLEGVNQTELPQGHDANSKPDWLPIERRMSECLFVHCCLQLHHDLCWETIQRSENDMQASLLVLTLRIYLWKSKTFDHLCLQTAEGHPLTCLKNEGSMRINLMHLSVCSLV